MTQIGVRRVGNGASMVRDGLKNIARLVPVVAKQETRKVLQEVADKMQEPGDNPTHPIAWVSEKQRRAFFATDGFGGGIPHKRTGEYQAGWKVKEIPDGYKVVNDRDEAKYIGGNAFGLVQSPIHEGRWNLLKVAFDAEISKLHANIERAIEHLARASGFGR